MQIVVVEDPTQAALLVASFERTDEDATEESGLRFRGLTSREVCGRLSTCRPRMRRRLI
jgi:hypothetical protein